MLWDGLGFFGFDDTKLSRVKGNPVKFTDKCTSKTWIITTLITFVVGIYIVIGQIENLNQVKSQTISLMSNFEYSYNISE